MMRICATLAALVVGLHARLMAQTPVPPQGPQVAAIQAGINSAQTTINSMPPGPNRDRLQQGLNNFKKMWPKRVFVSPHPEGGPNPGPASACTTAEYIIRIPGGGESGGTREVGSRNEVIVLGSSPAGNPSPPNNAGGVVGPPDNVGYDDSDPGVTGGFEIHEGIRTNQEWTADANGDPRDPTECFRKWQNDVDVYNADVIYYEAWRQRIINSTMPAEEKERYLTWIAKNLKFVHMRIAEAERMRSQCGN